VDSEKTRFEKADRFGSAPPDAQSRIFSGKPEEPDAYVRSSGFSLQ
jgi:hypothetical protein